MAENFNNTVAQSFYGIIVLCITISNLITYQVLTRYNQNDSHVLKQMKARYHWLILDILIKIIGLLLTITVFPPAMMYSVLITLIVLVIPNQISSFKN